MNAVAAEVADALPEPDRIAGAPHPRHAARVFGHGSAEQTFLEAFTSGRLHHGWLLAGPRGIGKATLAWHMARFLLATPEAEGGLFGAPAPPDSLAVDPGHPVAHRLAALSEPGLFLLRRGGAGDTERLREKNYADGKFSAVIRVDEVRRLAEFIHLSASDGGRRVVIVDAADEMNPAAANAILKMLEEPPARTTFLLIAHQPARLLSTIRSRCRLLRLAPLGADVMGQALTQAGVDLPGDERVALNRLSGGSAGVAIALIEQEGLALYAELVALLGSLPMLDRARLIALSESCAGKAREARLALVLMLTDFLTARLARAGAVGAPDQEIVPGEAALLARLAPDAAAARHWAQLAQEASDRARHAVAVNVDAASVVTDLYLQLARGAG